MRPGYRIPNSLLLISLVESYAYSAFPLVFYLGLGVQTCPQKFRPPVPLRELRTLPPVASRSVRYGVPLRWGTVGPVTVGSDGLGWQLAMEISGLKKYIENTDKTITERNNWLRKKKYTMLPFATAPPNKINRVRYTS